MTRWLLAFVAAWMTPEGGGVIAREWNSSDGRRSFEAGFVRVQGDQLMLGRAGEKPSAFPLAAFSMEDQKFAANAQAIADAAAKWGSQSFEVSQVVDGGCICRLALPPASKTGPTLFTGEMFFLVASDSVKAEPGEQMKGRLLFAAGGLTYHPLKGEPVLIRAFALDAEKATSVWMETVAMSNGDAAKQSPPVMEPEIEIVTTRGLGIAVGKSGLFAIDPELVKDAGSLVVHHDGEDHPAKLVKMDEKLGVAVVSCALPMEPARIGSKKPAELGQSVYAVSTALNANKRALSGGPTVTRGIVSRLANAKADAFEHDATLSAESPGGFIVGMKGEVLGLFFKSQTTTRALTSKKPQAIKGSEQDLGGSLSTAALSAFLDAVPGASLKTAPTETDVAKVTKELMKGTVLVVSTREVNRPRVIASGKTKAATGAGGPVTGWSLSKSGTRHNSKCRFYDANLSCAATDGKPCKTCGG